MTPPVAQLAAGQRLNCSVTVSQDGNTHQQHSLGGSTANGHKALTAEIYAEAVRAHSKQTSEKSLYPGHNYETLAQYLTHFLRRSSYPTDIQKQSESLVTLYSLYVSGNHKVENLKEPKELQEHELLRQAGKRSSQILFLRGLPCSNWLSTIGATYRIDPEFFQRHVDFRSTFSRWEYFPLPSLPSASNNIVKLRYVTLGQWDRKATKAAASQDEIDKQRAESAKAMNRYMHQLRLGMVSDLEVGNSIVRDFSVYDEVHFAIEQEISICVNKPSKGWTATVWLDTGNDLSRGIPGPWQTSGKNSGESWCVRNFNDVIQIQPCGALKSHKTALAKENRPNSNLPQSSALLHLEYGKLLDQELMTRDAFYAMNEIFTFVAFSEAEFLNMLESKLSADSGFTLMSQRSLELSNLLYIQKNLEAHGNRLRENIETIKARGGTDWPRASQVDHVQKAEAAAASLLKDFEYLLQRTQILSTRCQAGMSYLMNKTMIAESQRSLSQAREVTKLTRLAFIYIPLNFISSLLGMNLTPLVDARYNLGLYFAVAIPVLGISLLFMVWNIPRMLKSLGNSWRGSEKT